MQSKNTSTLRSNQIDTGQLPHEAVAEALRSLADLIATYGRPVPVGAVLLEADPSPALRLLRRPEVAEQLGVSKSTVTRMIDAGELPVVRIGASVRVRSDVLDDWIASRSGGEA